MYIDPGELDQRVRIERRTGTANALNEVVGGWSLLAEVWARVRPARTRTRFAAAQAQSPVDTVVAIRYRADVLDGTHEHRLVHLSRLGAVPLAIDGEPVDVDAAGEYLEIACVKGVRDGR